MSERELLRQFHQYVGQDQQFRQLLRNTVLPGGTDIDRLLRQPFKPAWLRPGPTPRVPSIPWVPPKRSQFVPATPVLPAYDTPARLAMLYKLSRMRHVNVALDLFLQFEQQKFERQIIKMKEEEQQHLTPGFVEIGPHWNMVGDCGPWREDNVVPGGNFCFVHTGVPATALLRAVPPGFLSFYTVQNDTIEVPGGIDCTHAKSYASPDLNPDPQPVFHPPVVHLPLIPEQPTPENPYLPHTWKWGRVRGFPPPVPVPLANQQPGHNPAPNQRRRQWWKVYPPQYPVLPGRPRQPPHLIRRPPPGERQKKATLKFKKWQAAFMGLKGLVNGITETLDVLKAAYDALPWEVRKRYLRFGERPTPQKMAAILWLEVPKVNGERFAAMTILNLVKNEAGDRFFGEIGKIGGHAIKGNPYWVSPVGLQAGGRYRGAPVYVNQKEK